MKARKCGWTNITCATARLENTAISIQIGKFGTVVGNWVPRHYSWDNPFITAPLPYENLTGIWDSAAPDEVDTLFYWGHVGDYATSDYSDKYLRSPIIWGPSYATGAALSRLNRQIRLRRGNEKYVSLFPARIMGRNSSRVR